MNHICVASVKSMADTADIRDETDGMMAIPENGRYKTSLHEVTLTILGLKSVVSNLVPNLHVVVALLDEHGQVTAKTALSAEFGSLHDHHDDHRNSGTSIVAVWQDENSEDANLYFDVELKISSHGIMAVRETKLVIALADISHNKETLRCTPVGRASLLIKERGVAHFTTQVVPIWPTNESKVAPFQVNNPYYKPNPRSSLKPSRFGQRSRAALRFKKNKFGFSHSPFRKQQQQQQHQLLYEEEINFLTPEDEQRIMETEEITATLQSGMLLLEASWRKKEHALEAVLDLAMLGKDRSMSNSIMSDDKILTTMQTPRHCEVKKDSPLSDGDNNDESETQESYLLDSNATAEGSPVSLSTVSRDDSRQSSGRTPSSGKTFCGTAEMTEATPPTSNTHKSHSLLRDSMVAKTHTENSTSTSSPFSDTTPRSTLSLTLPKPPAATKKRFWRVFPLAALKRRFSRKHVVDKVSSPTKADPKQPLPSESPVPETTVETPTRTVFDPFALQQEEEEEQEEQEQASLPISPPELRKNRSAESHVSFDPPTDETIPARVEELDGGLEKNLSTLQDEDEISQILGKMGESNDQPVTAKGDDDDNVVVDIDADVVNEEEAKPQSPFPPSALEFTKENTSFASISIGEHFPYPLDITLEDATMTDDTTVTMMRELDPKDDDEEEDKPKQRSQSSLFSILPQCAGMFDSDPSKHPVLDGYNNLLDDEETLSTMETNDSKLKKKLKIGRCKQTDGWWNDGMGTRPVEDELLSLGGFEYHQYTDILQARVPGSMDDDLSHVPRPEDVVWTEFYKGCGVQTAEYLTDGFVQFPEKLFSFFQPKRMERLEESPTMLSLSDHSDSSSDDHGSQVISASHTLEVDDHKPLRRGSSPIVLENSRTRSLGIW